MATLLYLHGFNSSPRSAKATALKTWLAQHYPEITMVVPELPPYPAETAELLESIVLEHGGEPLGVVGSSLGGYYATWLAERHGLRAVLINPAVVAPLALESFVGMQDNLYTGERFEFTHQHLDELRTLEVAAITRPERYWLLAETGDEVLDYSHAVIKYAGARQTILEGGNHGFSRWKDYLDAVIDFAVPAGDDTR